MSLLLPRRAISRPERALNVIGTGSPITPGATMTKVPGTTGTTYAGGGVTSGAAWRLVAPADGRYSLKANIHFDVSEAVEVEFGFVVNGTATGSEHLRGFSPGASAESVAHLSDSLDLSAGDYVEPFCRCTASGTASISVNLGIGLGMGMQRQPAVAVAGFTVPLLASNCLSFLHADSGPVGTPTTEVGNDVTDWLSLTDATAGAGPYDWTQTGGTVRGVIDETTFSGGRRSVLFQTADYMRSVGLGLELAGTSVPFTRYTHFVGVNWTTNGYLLGLSGQDNSIYDSLRMDIGSDPSAIDMLRRGLGGTALSTTTAGTYAKNLEMSIVEIQTATNTRTVWINSVKVFDAISWDTGVALSFTDALIAIAEFAALATGTNIAARRLGYWDVALNDTQAGVLNALHGS